MIELQTLGTLRLCAPDAPNAADTCTRPKPLGLLVYLTTARPSDFEPQDSLLAIFWPGSDSVRAQQSLRQALHLIRRSLGEEIIERRGRAELGANATLISADAVQFDALVRAGNLKGALTLYSGEFLGGFRVHDAPEFEQWVVTERIRLHALAIAAAETLAQQAFREGQTDSAAEWARRWVELAPHDARAAEFLTSQNHSYHQQPELNLRSHPAFHASNATGQSPVTSHTSSASVGRVGSKLGHSSVSEQYSAPPLHSGNQSAPREKLPLRSRFFGAALSVAATVAIIATALGLRQLRTRFNNVSAQRNAPDTRVAVLPFTVRGTNRISYLRDGMVDLLAGKLDNADGVTTVNAGTVLSYEATNGPITEDLAAAATIARNLNAGQFVLGHRSRGAIF